MNLIFLLIIILIVTGFFIDQVADFLNLKSFPNTVPSYLEGFRTKDQLLRARAYYREGYSLGLIKDSISLILILAVLFFGILPILNQWVCGLTEKPFLQAALFFSVIFLGSELAGIAFEYYDEFVIEQKYGFNRMSKLTFVTDKLKSWLIGALLAAALLWVIIQIYLLTPEYFWLLAWGAVALFSLFFSLFYSDIIVPLFNKQKPLEDGPLRQAVENFASKAGFKIKEIYVLDGSKRSSKANAYFSGWGPRKRIVLYDTLIEKHSIDELVAVLAHEIGHYKYKHVLKGTFLSLLSSLLMFYLLGLFLRESAFTEALGLPLMFHTSVLVFGILWSPLSSVISLISNKFSVTFEYQADAYAAKMFAAEPLINALMKLSSDHLSHPSPHPLFVAMHYSHPPLESRVRELKKIISPA